MPQTTLELTGAEVHLLRNALHSFMSDFGHDEANVIADIRALLAKLPAPAPDVPIAAR
jgi:hypothetical protein